MFFDNDSPSLLSTGMLAETDVRKKGVGQFSVSIKQQTTEVN